MLSGQCLYDIFSKLGYVCKTGSVIKSIKCHIKPSWVLSETHKLFQFLLFLLYLQDFFLNGSRLEAVIHLFT